MWRGPRCAILTNPESIHARIFPVSHDTLLSMLIFGQIRVRF